MPSTTIKSASVSVVAIREVEGRHQVLLLKRAETLAGTWCQIAGGLENSETAWQAALRELREETKLTPEMFYSADILERFYEPDNDCIVIIPVFVAFISADAQVVINHEHSAFEWVSFDKALEMVSFSGQRRVLQHVRVEFVERSPNEHLRINFG